LAYRGIFTLQCPCGLWVVGGNMSRIAYNHIATQIYNFAINPLC
jgi:hypothetical protein